MGPQRQPLALVLARAALVVTHPRQIALINEVADEVIVCAAISLAAQLQQRMAAGLFGQRFRARGREWFANAEDVDGLGEPPAVARS